MIRSIAKWSLLALVIAAPMLLAACASTSSNKPYGLQGSQRQVDEKNHIRS